MWVNNWKIALRHIRKNKTASAVNITGLAIGMAACLLILQFVSFELSYDQFHANGKHIYRVVNDRYQGGKLVQHGTITYSGVSRAMKEDYPEEVAGYARVEHYRSLILINVEKQTEESGLAVDNSFLSMFSFPFVAGDPSRALKDPNSIVLSERLARKFINGKEDVRQLIGKAIVMESDSISYKITGICKNPPENSHLQFDFLFSYVSLYSGGNGAWAAADYGFNQSDFYHYVQLKPGVDYKAFNKKLPAFSQKHFQGNKISGSEETFYLQPLARAHLYSDFEYDWTKTGNATTVWGLLLIAVFIIVIAWVNYINLATARSMERAREVGVRKVIGAGRAQLVRQFLVESTLVNIAALILAVFLVYLVQPMFNSLLEHHLTLAYLFRTNLNGYNIIAGLALLIVAGIIVSGFYPAFVLSSFKPITVLKGKLGSSAKGLVMRKGLVIGQFAITVCLIIGSLVVYRQMLFINNRPLGFNMDQMLIVKPPFLNTWTDTTYFHRLLSFKNEVKKLARVKGATGSYRVPGVELGRVFDVRVANDSADHRYTLRHWGIHHDFAEVYQMTIRAGRDFTPTDHNRYINRVHNILINESAVKLFGFSSPASAIGKQIKFQNQDWDIVGVTADFHQKSLRHPIEPVIMVPSYSYINSTSIKVSSTGLSQTIAAVKKQFETFFPGNLFDYYFLDERFNEQYKLDQLFGNVFGIFAALAIFIACLGLFGLSLYTISQRTKEIGVRKILGASVKNIVLLLSGDFIKLVIIASLLSFPLAGWVMNNWLNDFAYRTDLTWWMFAAAGMLAVTIALATIGFHAIKSAMANPVNALRSE